MTICPNFCQGFFVSSIFDQFFITFIIIHHHMSIAFLFTLSAPVTLFFVEVGFLTVALLLSFY